MVNAGLLGMTVVDEWLADLWSPILTDMVVHKDIACAAAGRSAGPSARTARC